MANKKKGFKKKTIKEEYGNSGGMGTYSEGTGGGEPMGQGQKYPQGGRGTWTDNYNQKPDRKTGQPRDAGGRFTYNSVNGKGLAPTSDPTRGKTVNPLLKDDKGAKLTYIEDVEKEFSQESGSYWDKYKDKWYRKGGEIVLGDAKVHVAGESIWNIAKGKFDEVKGEFVKEEGSFNETRKGRHGVEERTAKQKAKSSKDEAAVIDNKGGIKLKPGVSPSSIVTPTPAKPYRPKRSGVTPTAPIGGGQPAQPISGTYLKAPQQNQPQSGAGLSPTNLNALNNLFGGSGNNNNNNNNNAAAPTGPQITLANFLNSQKNKK